MKSTSFIMLTITLILVSLISSITTAQPYLKHGNIEILFNNCNYVNLNHRTAPVGSLRITLFGPGWYWENPCSLHDQWQVISDYEKKDGEYDVKCRSYCSFAKIAWNMKTNIVDNIVLLDITAIAENDSDLEYVTVEFIAFIEYFGGKDVYAMTINGKKISVSLPKVHKASWLGGFSNGLAWIIPLGENEGVLITVLGEDWTSGIELGVQDNREWGSNTYSLRFSLFRGTLFQGDLLRFLILVIPYNGTEKLDEVAEWILSLFRMISRGALLDEVKYELVMTSTLTPSPAPSSTPKPTPTPAPTPTLIPTPTPSPIQTLEPMSTNTSLLGTSMELFVIGTVLSIIIIIIAYRFLILTKKEKH